MTFSQLLPITITLSFFSSLPAWFSTETTYSPVSSGKASWISRDVLVADRMMSILSVTMISSLSMSLIQTTSGSGYPAISKSMVTESPFLTVSSWGPPTTLAGAMVYKGLWNVMEVMGRVDRSSWMMHKYHEYSETTTISFEGW